MDYKKKYKQLHTLISDLYPFMSEYCKEKVEGFFPELAGSEDEIIKEKLIDTFNFYDPALNSPYLLGISKKDVIAWLEKQGEQKVSYTTLVETGNGGINTLVTRKLSTNDYEEEPADKVEPFDKYEGLTDFERTLADICIGWIGEELGWKQYIKDNADVLLKIAVEKFNSVQDVPFEQKSAWSEKDETALGDALWAIKQARTIAKDENDMGNLWYAEDWLKSLKDRVQPQSQNRWKPSDEQMATLYKYAEQNNYDGSILTSLYNDLKKLREE